MYRSNRNNAAQRGTDDGTNPLLQRSAQTIPGQGLLDRPESISDWMDPMRTNRLLRGGDTPVSFISNLINAMSHGTGHVLHHHRMEGGRFSLTIGGVPGPGIPLAAIPPGARPPNAPTLPFLPPFGLRRTPELPSRVTRDDPAQAVAFVPTLTVSRWQDEARLLFGNNYIESTQRVINTILRLMVPPAIQAQEMRKAEEERKEKEEAEAKAKEKEGRESKEKKEREEREAAEIESAARAREEAQAEQEQEQEVPSDTPDQDQSHGGGGV